MTLTLCEGRGLELVELPAIEQSAGHRFEGEPAGIDETYQALGRNPMLQGTPPDGH